MLRWLVVVGIALGVACGAAALPAVPGKGGPAWIELSSEHFTMWTDAKPDRARQLLRQIERFRRVIAGIAFPGIPASARGMIVALRDDSELSVFSPTGENRAFATTRLPALWQPAIVMSAFSNTDRNDVTAAHELAHLVSFAAIRYQPRWLAEGLAQFFETVGLDADAATIEVGGTSWGRDRRLPSPASVASLFAWRGIQPGAEERRLYVTAWGLVTFLLNTHGEEFLHYLELLDRVAEVPAAQQDAAVVAAWRAAFPSLPEAEVDAVFRPWLTAGRHVVTTIRVRPQDEPIAERSLPEGDVYALYAIAHRADAERPKSQAEIAAALAADPTNILAHALAVLRGTPQLTAEVGRAIARTHPGDCRAWWLASLALPDPADRAERDAANRKACVLAARDAVQGAPLRCPVDPRSSSR